MDNFNEVVLELCNKLLGSLTNNDITTMSTQITEKSTKQDVMAWFDKLVKELELEEAEIDLLSQYRERTGMFLCRISKEGYIDALKNVELGEIFYNSLHKLTECETAEVNALKYVEKLFEPKINITRIDDLRIAVKNDLLEKQLEFAVSDTYRIAEMFNQPNSSNASFSTYTSTPPDAQEGTHQVYEGLPSFFQCQRTEKIKWLVKTVSDNTYVLITAPPQSGKTCTGLLFHKYVKGLGTHTTAFLSFAGFCKGENIKAFFKKRTDQDFDAFISQHSILVIDEAQAVYDQDWFWQNFKANNFSKVSILAFATYGSKSRGMAQSPLLFSKKLSFAEIAFSQTEFEMWTNHYGKQNQFLKGELEEHIQTLVGHNINGFNQLYHPGLTVACLHFFVDRKIGSSAEGMQLVDNGTMSSNLHRKCRAFARFEDLDTAIEQEKLKEYIKSGAQDNPKHLEILNDCIRQLALHGSVVQNDSNSICMQVLFKYGFCYELETQDGETKYCTTCPLVQVYLIQRFRKPFVEKGYQIESLPKFVMDVIKRFDVSQLKYSLSRGEHGLVNENQYVVEFYKRSGQIYNGRISLEVGASLGSKGRIDIYINRNLNFGIEFIKNGSKLKGHLERFNETYGIYSNLVKTMNDFLLVDFYENHDFDSTEITNQSKIDTVVQTGLENNYLVVLYKDNFERVEFYKIDKEKNFFVKTDYQGSVKTDYQ